MESRVPGPHGISEDAPQANARFSIGIDLGTTNSALAFVPLDGSGAGEILPIPQWDSLAGLATAPMLPSFLYLPEDAVAAQLSGRAEGSGEWIVGRLARRKAGEVPGRVVHSAKSWLCHHTADRSAPVLPWGSDDVSAAQKISPVRASALILNYLRGAWNERFADAGCAFDDQEITITVPASFDAAAQRLTLEAAKEAGFPNAVRLLEEPQAAFYAWLEQHDPVRELCGQPGGGSGPLHVVIIDMGGGTLDFSLFQLRPRAGQQLPDISRVAVSEHILLGGDNIDLALAHFAEVRLAGERGRISGGEWDHLVASSRDLKEQVLSSAGPAEETFAIALPGRGAGLLAGARTATLTRAEIESLLLDGFFPDCDARARPFRTQAALREWGLPYAADSAVTRHLAAFLGDCPQVDAILFNGGSLAPSLFRQRLRDQIGQWQDGCVPAVLENADPALAVARGAARSVVVRRRHAAAIEAGAAFAVFLEVQGDQTTDGAAGAPSLVCVLPRGAPPETNFRITRPALELRTDRLVRFQAYSSARDGGSRAGDIVTWRDGDFHALPPLQTRVERVGPSGGGTRPTVPVQLEARMNAVGLLQVACVSTDPNHRQSWPLEFNLRPHEHADNRPPAATPVREGTVRIAPNAAEDALDAACSAIGRAFGQTSTAAKVTSAGLFKRLEAILGMPKGQWNAALLRALWPELEHSMDRRGRTVDHEEAWLGLAGFLLRPGFGMAADDMRLDALWRVHEAGPCFPGRRIKAQEYLLWRRVAGGLTRERQQKLLSAALPAIRGGKAPPELVLLAGSLELISRDSKTELIRQFIETAATLARGRGHAGPYFGALGLLLNRTPAHAGPETVVSPDYVERAYAAFREYDWAEPRLVDLQTMFLRAARVVGDRSLDVPKTLRNLIAGKLEKAGVSPLRIAPISEFVPLGQADRASLYDGSLPPGLVLGLDQDPGNAAT